MYKLVDFRTDTNAAPSAEMIEVAFKAPLGDAVYNLDQKTLELEEYAAKMLGKEKAIFLPSGVMGNLVALLSHTQRGEEIILEENSHICTSETGGAAAVAGLMLKTIRSQDGAPKAQEIELAIRPSDQHYPKTSLICLENTHYRYGGIVVPIERFKEIREISEKYHLPIHLDGARLFNAAVHSGVTVKKFSQYVDSVMFSLSKGLGAPVGSMLCGSEEFIIKAIRFRKMLGGGMRKIGWLSACGLVALKDPNLYSRLLVDHQKAKRLAKGINKISGITVDLLAVQTNMILAYLGKEVNRLSLLKFLEKENIFIAPLGKNGLRFYISADIEDTDINYTIEKLKKGISI